MSILLTGGAGYIGTHTIVALSEAGYSVIVADDFSNSLPQAIDRVEAIINKSIPCYNVDVCDREALSNVFDKHKDITGVIHFAGYKAVGESVVKPMQYYRNNLDSTLTLCEVMLSHGVNNIVFSSSATVYGVTDTMPLTEDMPTGSTNPYGWTKFMIERMLTDIAHSYKDMSVVLLRYFNPVGAHQSGSIGEEPRGIPNNLMPYISKVALGALPIVQVYGNDYNTPDGTCIRDYIHVMDLAQGHVAAYEYASKNKGTQTINLGTGRGVSVIELIEAYAAANNLDIPYVITGRRAGDIARCYADASKAKLLLNWEAKRSIEDMCRDSWRWQKANPKGYESDKQ